MRLFLSTLLWFSLTVSFAWALDVGDPAPDLQISRWINGPATAPDLRDGTLRVLEFWATWCPPCLDTAPHLSELQKRYGDAMEIIGISNQTPEDVESFLETVDVSYRIALDENDLSFERYLDAAGIDSIPYSFLVGGDGTILWHGHPLSGLDEMIEAVIEGRFDLQAVLARQEHEQRIGKALELIDVYEYLRSSLEERDLADQVIQRVFDLGENDPRFLVFLGLFATTRQDDFLTARRAFTLATRLPGGSRPDVHLMFAEILRREGAHEQAGEQRQMAEAMVAPEPIDETAMVESLKTYLEDYQDVLAY